MKKKILFTLTIFIFIILSACKANQVGNEDFYNYYYSENTEEYAELDDNPIREVLTSPLSTFSIDVDTASYSNMRRRINDGYLPQKGAVRTEELINYFNYDYPEPVTDDPFNVITEVAVAPWNEKRLLAKIALQAKNIEFENLPANNLVLLLDVSGSMNESLELVKASLRLLVNNLREEDTISIVVYSGAAGVVLEPTTGSNKEKIIRTLDSLQAGGSTAGEKGINLAYKLAEDNFKENGNNRIILATDGDFNVGVSSNSDLENLIEEKRNDNIFLSVLGFGTGNIKDNKMETLADKGNGNYSYIDSLMEAKKVLVEEMGSTLLTIAKDVKIQVEFNPATVKGYRLIGYENRILNNEDFNDDTKDAGEFGVGHTVTAFYELIPTDSDEVIDNIDDLKYQEQTFTDFDDFMTIKLRYKEPVSEQSKLLEHIVKVNDKTTEPSINFLFASSVAEFALLLRNSPYKGNANYDHVIMQAKASLGDDEYGYRNEFVRLVELAKEISMDDN
ncbi:MAG: hypothetical protein K0Q49_149 [Haloplasmataceae bacterium]|nr:hypothetical protein [Haloplasmataceae bacterium]